MPIVHIEIWAGENEDLKKNLGKAITDVVVANVGCPAQAVTVIFNEIPRKNWVIGGQSCSELFKDKDQTDLNSDKT